MTAVYAFAAIVGWPFLLFFVFFGDDGGDADVDADADLEVEAGEGIGAGVASAFLSLLSFRSLVFFLAFFGATGLILTALRAAQVLVVAAALLLGLFAAGLNNRLFRYLKSTSVATEIGNQALSGALAKVTVPISARSRGRVTCRVEGQTVNLTAVPFDVHEQFEVGETVVVVEVDRGIARVSSMRELS